MATARKTTTRTTGQTDVDAQQWTDDEIAAMKAHAQELKTARKRSGSADKDAEGEADVIAKISEMPAADRVMAQRIHEIVKSSAPGLASRTWYGMPAYTRDGKVVCFFKAASKFNGRYATFGFEEQAALDDGQMWPTSWALTKLTPAGEKQIAELVRKAAG
jgi:uncharacterized protein YdhG (YjbR/CyaY superfamily)